MPSPSPLPVLDPILMRQEKPWWNAVRRSELKDGLKSDAHMQQNNIKSSFACAAKCLQEGSGLCYGSAPGKLQSHWNVLLWLSQRYTQYVRGHSLEEAP